ncbi:MAG: nuclease [Cyclobacteriaceae bacterium]|nr:nuclease [Cyclobacteriaceae bacterium]
MKSKILSILILCCVALIAHAEEIKGVVTKVIDGNTIEISADDHETYKVLLHGIDSPESGQDYAEQATKLLSKLLLKKSVTILIHGKDRLGNRLGEIRIDSGVDPRHELIKQGLAWTAEKNPISELESLKEEARLKGKGLWKDNNPTPPWIFRRQQTLTQQKSS